MQISHESEKIAQVSFGTKSNRVASMADNSAFFHILSASLYSQPRLAALREIICNADDAHKQAGVARPIDISIVTDENDENIHYLTIRDYGTGIPDALMDEIYLVFGESTKKDVAVATGGFGLGSKAPWAIVDQFFVTSYHQGIVTMYTLVKADPDNDNKPAIQTMFSGPTNETGLEVRVPLPRNTVTKDVLNQIEALLYYGDIPANIKFRNDAVASAKQLGMDTTAGAVMLIPQRNNLHRTAYDSTVPYTIDKVVARASNVYIRYGTVIYPVTTPVDLPDVFNHVWLIQAPPNSISLNPNRETLLYSETTLETLKALCTSIRNSLKQIPRYSMSDAVVIKNVINGLIDRVETDKTDTLAAEALNAVWSKAYSLKQIDPFPIRQQVEEYMVDGAASPIKPLLIYRASKVIYDCKNINPKAFRDLWRNKLIEEFVKGGATRAQAVSEAALVQHLTPPTLRYRSSGVGRQSRTTPPKRARKNLMELRNIIGNTQLMYSGLSSEIFKIQTRYIFTAQETLVALLTRKVTIARVYGDWDAKQGILGGFLIRTSSARLKSKWAADLKAAGWNVVDAWSEPTRSTTVKTKAPSITATGGYLCAAGAMKAVSVSKYEHDWWDTLRAVESVKSDGSHRISKPIAYVKGSTAKNSRYAGSLSTRLHASPVTHAFASKLALITASAQAAKLEKAGIPELSKYVADFFKNLPLNGKLCVYGALSTTVWSTFVDKPNSSTNDASVASGLLMVLAKKYPFAELDQAVELVNVLDIEPRSMDIFLPIFDGSIARCFLNSTDHEMVICNLPKDWPKPRMFVDYSKLLVYVANNQLSPQDALINYFD